MLLEFFLWLWLVKSFKGFLQFFMGLLTGSSKSSVWMKLRRNCIAKTRKRRRRRRHGRVWKGEKSKNGFHFISRLSSGTKWETRAHHSTLFDRYFYFYFFSLICFIISFILSPLTRLVLFICVSVFQSFNMSFPLFVN